MQDWPDDPRHSWESPTASGTRGCVRNVSEPPVCKRSPSSGGAEDGRAPLTSWLLLQTQSGADAVSPLLKVSGVGRSPARSGGMNPSALSRHGWTATNIQVGESKAHSAGHSSERKTTEGTCNNLVYSLSLYTWVAPGPPGKGISPPAEAASSSLKLSRKET